MGGQGFMSGFGRGFSKAYGEGLDRRHDKEKEAFQVTFQMYMKRKDAADAYKKEQSQLVSSATTLVEKNGLPDYAVGDAYDMLRSGYSLSETEKRLKAGSWKETDEADSAQKPASVAEEAPLSGPDQVTSDGSPPPAVAPEVVQTAAATGAPAPVPPAPPAPNVNPDPNAFPPAPDPNAPPIDPAVAQAQAAQAQPVEAPVATAAPVELVPPEMGAGIKRISELTGQTPEQIQADMADNTTEPVMKPSGKFVPGPPEMDWVSDEEAVFKRDAARDSGNKVEEARYQKVIDAYDERANRKAMLENPQGTRLVQWINEDGTVETKAAMQTEDGWVRTDGEGPVPDTARIIGDEEQKRRDKIVESNPEAIKLQGKQNMATNIFRDGVQVIGILDQYPDSVAGIGKLAAGVSDLTAEAQAAINILNQDNTEHPEAASQALQTLDEETKRIDQYLSQGIKDAGEAARLLNAKLVLMSYRAGDVEGIRGRDVTEKEYNRMYNVITGGSSDAKVVKKSLVQYMNNLRSNLKQETKLFNGNKSDYQQYESDFGTGTAPTAGLVEDIDTMLLDSGDPELKAAHDLLTKKKMDIPDAPEEQIDLSGIDPEAVKLLKEHPELASKFDETFGPGASDAILGKKSKGAK